MNDIPTPRTDAATYAIIGYPHETQPFEVVMKREAGDSVVNSSFARQLETELAEATSSPYIDNDQVPVQVIAEIYDALDGITDDAANGHNFGSLVSRVKTAVKMATELAAVTSERDELKGWKESAIAVEREWDCQKLGRLIGAPLGGSIRKALMQKVPELQAQLAQMREALEEVQEYFKDRMDADHNGSRFVGNIEMKHYQAIEEAISTPAPPVVPLEDVKPLVEDLQNWIAVYGNEYTEQLLASFTAKHPSA